MVNKKKIRNNTGKILLAASVVVATGVLWLSSGKGQPFTVPAYTVDRVIDGDTFITTDKQYIRLASVDAPEMGLCGSEEAKQALEKLIVDKPIYLKVTFHDQFQRLISNVYTPEGYVNLNLLENGYAVHGSTSPNDDDLVAASERAREKKLGVFSEKCSQMANKEHPSCQIKGNDRNGKIYYVPNCGFYTNVTVQLYLGDRWFCSENEAEKAGFRKPEQCKNQTY